MSSNTYSARLDADPCLRKFVLISGLLLAAGGVLLLLTMPLPLPLMLPAAAAWLCLCIRDIRQLRRAYTRYCGLQMRSDGQIRLLDDAGTWQTARLLAGSVLLRRLGWIRVADAHGFAFAELVRGNCREGQEWRRLQVLWRHVGAHS